MQAGRRCRPAAWRSPTQSSACWRLRRRLLASRRTSRDVSVRAAMPVAVVTGASSGIGAALCRELRSRGWHVVGLSRRPAPDADEHEECDVSDREMVGAVARRVLDRHPQINLLVNNAGIPVRGNYLDSEPQQMEAVMQTN